MTTATVTWNTVPGSANTIIPVTLDPTIIAKNTCTQVDTLVKGTASVNSFLHNYKLSSTDSSQNILKRLQELRSKLEETKLEQRANTNIEEQGLTKYLDTLDSNVRYLRFVDECLKSSSQQDKLNEQKDKTEESKIRFESLQSPEERVSYYEGWFPLFRPISESGLFVLFGFALLFLFYSSALFLRMSGITLDITLPTSVVGDTYGISFLEGYGPIVVGFGLGLLTATFYYFTR